MDASTTNFHKRSKKLSKDAHLELFSIKRSLSGLGLFTRKPMTRGCFIIEYTGERIPSKEADHRGGLYLFSINSRWTIDGKGRKHIARYINHCCDPNCEPRISKGKILIYAIRDISEGEELTYDYGEEYFNTYIQPKGCTCARCV